MQKLRTIFQNSKGTRKCVSGKLMRFNRPKAKIPLKSDSNHLLINFFDTNGLLMLNRRDKIETIPADGKKIEKFDFRSILIKMVKFDQLF